MKKSIITLIAAIAVPFIGLSQVSSEPTENINPEDSVKIIVDLSQLNQGLDHVQNLLQAAADGEDMYMWTWNPYEFPEGHPKANGSGSQAWKNSNELLKMTHEGGDIYSYKMIPTEFYEVDAATVYQNDIHFLVKPKDGGGYGDPDYKSEDLMLAVDPPVTEKKPVFGFSSKLRQDDIYTVYYDNYRETKSSMQNLDEDDCYMYSECTLTDGTTIKIENFFDVGDNPDLQMEYYDEGRFRLTFVPFEFFDLVDGNEIETMKFVVMKKVYLDNDDRVDEDFDVEVCVE